MNHRGQEKQACRLKRLVQGTHENVAASALCYRGGLILSRRADHYIGPGFFASDRTPGQTRTFIREGCFRKCCWLSPGQVATSALASSCVCHTRAFSVHCPGANGSWCIKAICVTSERRWEAMSGFQITSMILTSCQANSVRLNTVHSTVSCGILNAACLFTSGEGGPSRCLSTTIDGT